MFSPDFYPTPPEVIAHMIGTNDIYGKTILEPSAGKGDLVDALKAQGATVLCCEMHPELAEIAASKATFLAYDFLGLRSEQISHIHAIYMNPPFSNADKHILHAWEIAPDGCHIVALCNANTLDRDHTQGRRQLTALLRNYGTRISLGNCFAQAERTTDVQVALINLYKPASADNFDGYFSDEADDELPEGNGLLPYNAVREVVQRYVNALRLYDQVIDNAVSMNSLVGEFGIEKLTFTCREGEKDRSREEFRRGLQNKAWEWIFRKMDMEKFVTKRLRDDINRFVEHQTKVPFTMRNIYKMMQLIAGTHSQRMDKALIDVFDRLTQYHHDNRYNVEGWKTNSHYLMGEKFILPYMVAPAYHGGMTLSISSHNTDLVEDLVKALCYITGRNYTHIGRLNAYLHEELPLAPNESTRRYRVFEYGKWYEWGFFRIKGFKKGTMHFQFLDLDVWALFNQHIARIKGYPLPESVSWKAA